MADNRYLLFCAMCYLAAISLGSELAAYQTQDSELYTQLFLWRSSAGLLCLLVWAWFVFLYTTAGHRIVPYLFSAGLGMHILMNMVFPFGGIFETPPVLRNMTLPWGETVTVANFSINTLGSSRWLLVIGLVVYTLFAAYRQHQRGQRRESVTMTIGTVVFVALAAENFFVRAGYIDFIFTAGYSFPALLIIMGMSLHRDAVEVVERLYAVTDYVPAALHIKDTKGRYLMVNRAYEGRYHVSQKDVLHKTDLEIHDKSIAQRKMDFDRQVLQKMLPVEYSETSEDDSGNMQHYQTFKYPLFDRQGQLFALCGISIDITERRHARSQLGKTESKYRALFENAHDAIFILKDGEFLECNQRACEMFRCKKEDFNGGSAMNFSPEIQPDGRHSARLAAEKIDAAMNGRPQLFEWQHRRLDGTLFDAEVHLSYLELDGVACLQGLVRDVSERKQAERDLVRQRQLLETSVNATPGGYFMFNTKGVVVYSNRTFQKTTGLSPAELASINVIDYFVHPDDLHIAYRVIEQAVRVESTVSEQLRVLIHGGTVKTLLVTVSRFNIDDETYLVAAAVDISDRVAAEMELNIYRDQLEGLVAARTMALESANQELESFSYSVSHDLRAPLRTINGFSRALMDEYGEFLGEEGRGYLARVMASSIRMGNLIDDILKLSRINRSTVNFSRVDLSAMADRIIREFRADAQNRRVNVTIASNMAVTGDPRLLEIMLTNLLNNAWKYTGKREQAEIEFGQMDDESGTVFYVRDNGAGFDSRYADKLFGAFQRLHGDEFPGTGIGLATVARVVHRHGGQVWAESTPGQGAAFYFRLKPTISDEGLARSVISNLASGAH